MIERVMPDRMVSSEEHAALARTDLNVLVGLAAQERTEAGWRAILVDAGFEVISVSLAGFGYGVIEATPLGQGGPS